MTNKQYWLSWSGVMAVVILAALFLLKPGREAALAQAGIDEAISLAGRGVTSEGMEAAQQTQPIDPQSDNSGVEPVPIAAFRHNGNNPNLWVHRFSGGYIESRSVANTAVILMAPTYPPSGATLTRFAVTLLDEHDPGNLTVRLWRASLTDPGTNSSEIVAELSPNRNDPDPARISVNISPALGAVSSDYTYYVVVTFPATNPGSAIKFYGANLFYTPAP